MKLSDRYEILLRAIHLNKSIPQQFSARHLVTRCKGLALKDHANMELKIAIVALVGTSLSIKALGKLLSEVIHGRRFGDYELQGHRTKEGAGYSCWQFTLLYFGAPVPEPAKPEPKPMTLDSLVADQEAADRQARDQQSRLEKAENREVLEELARKNAEQRRAMKQRDPLDEPSGVNPHMSKREEADIKPIPRWKAGLAFFHPRMKQMCTFIGTPEAKQMRDASGRCWDIQETAAGPPQDSPQGILNAYLQIINLAIQRGDTRSVQEIAEGMRGMPAMAQGGPQIGRNIPLKRWSPFENDEKDYP